MNGMARRTRYLLATLGVVCAGWVVDIFIPDDGLESASAASAQPSPPPPEKLAEGDAEATQLLSLLERRRSPRAEQALMDNVRDPFTPSTYAAQAWSSPPVSATEAEAGRDEDTSSFEASHRLTGVLTGPVRMAIIDGNVYALGARVAGFTLMAIERDRVVLRDQSEEVALPIVRDRAP